MSTNLNELDPESPEYEAALQAAQQAEDEATGNVEPKAEGDQPAAADDDAKVQTEASAAPATTAAQPEPDKPADAKPAGVLGKDGKTVLPYGALKGAREEARRERQQREQAEQRAQALEQQIADIKAGKTPAEDAGEALTDEKEAEMLADFPALKPVFAQLKATRAELDRLKATAPAPKREPAEADPVADLQEAIDSVPLLAGWQAERGEPWARAVAIDASLQGSPKWKDKPLPERLAEVARRVADEFDIQAQEDTPPNDKQPSGKAKTTPEEAINKAGRTTPNTLSDFKGGAADPTRESFERMPATRLQARFEDMSDEEIEAALAKSGGG